MRDQEVQKLLKAAIECSFCISPKEPGLAYDELLEFGEHVSLQAGEIGDAIQHITTQFFGKAKARLIPKDQSMPLWHVFIFREDPEYRNIEAFDFLYEQFDACARAHGRANAKLTHNTIVERAITAGIKEIDIETAIFIALFNKQFIQENSFLRSANPQAPFQKPSDALRQSNANSRIMQHPERARAYPIVKGIIESRNPTSLEKLSEEGSEHVKGEANRSPPKIALTDEWISASAALAALGKQAFGARTICKRARVGLGLKPNKPLVESTNL